MNDWKEILDSPILHLNSYVSWEEYIRMMAVGGGYLTDGFIYPIFAHDEKYTLEPECVGFVFLPLPYSMVTTDYDEYEEEVMPIFFDHDNSMLFDGFIDYVYQFEEPDTWETDAELLLYHNRAAVIDEILQEEVEEFGVKEVLMAALRGQYDGHNSWASHPDE
jgi:hypothetical protein